MKFLSFIKKGQKKGDTGSENQKRVFGFDPKGRETILSGKDGNYKIEKPAIGFVLTDIKTADEAITLFNEQVNSSQN